MQAHSEYEGEYLPSIMSHSLCLQEFNRDPREYAGGLDQNRGAHTTPTSPDFSPSTSFYQTPIGDSPCFPWTTLGPAFVEPAPLGGPGLSYPTGASSSEISGKERNQWDDIMKEGETMGRKYQQADNANGRMLEADELNALSDEARAYHSRGISPLFAVNSSKFGRSSELEPDRNLLLIGTGQRKFSIGTSARTVAPVANHYPASFSPSDLDSRSSTSQYAPLSSLYSPTVPSHSQYRTPPRPSRPSLPEARHRLPVLPQINLEEPNFYSDSNEFYPGMTEPPGVFFNLPPLNLASSSSYEKPADFLQMPVRSSHSPSPSTRTTTSEYLPPLSTSPTNSDFSSWFQSSPPQSEFSDFSPSPISARQTAAGSSYSPPSRYHNIFHSMREEEDVISRYMDYEFLSHDSDEGERKRLNLGTTRVGNSYEEKAGFRRVERIKGNSEAKADLRPISPITGLPVKVLAKRSYPPKDAARRVYICQSEGCGKAFGRPSALSTHSRVHSGARPFVCPLPTCARPFSVFSNLKRHMMIHPEVDFRHVNVGDLPGILQATNTNNQSDQNGGGQTGNTINWVNQTNVV